MAKSEEVKKLHAIQIALAKEQFEAYKTYIVNEFVNEFGGSYQTPEQMKDIWRKTFKYEPECENFLEFKTRIFIRMLPNEDMINTPTFLRNFIRLVSDYLAVYVCRKSPECEYNNISNELYEKLCNSYVKHVLNRYQKRAEKEWDLRQKALQEAKPQEPAPECEQQKPVRTEKRKRINKQPVVIQQKQFEKLGAKGVRERIRLKKQEIAQFEISIRAIKGM